MNLDANTGESFGDTPIKEEEVDTYEVGFKTEFADSKARLNAALFSVTIKTNKSMYLVAVHSLLLTPTQKYTVRKSSSTPFWVMVLPRFWGEFS